MPASFRPSSQHVVRPFAAQLGSAGRRAPASASPSAERRDKAELRRAARPGTSGRSTSETIEIARRRHPDAAAPAAPGGLLARPDQRALRRRRRGPARLASSLVLPTGRSDSRRKPAASAARARVIPANSDAAAASAPPTIGPGSRKKNIVTSAGDRPAPPCSSARDRPVERADRLVEIHHLDDAQVIERADHAGRRRR